MRRAPRLVAQGASGVGRLLAALCACAANCGATSAVLASEPDFVSEARSAYDRGAAAYNEGNFAVAAAEFKRADGLVPNPAVLTMALKASLRVGDPVLGMTLVERAEGRADEALARTAALAHEKFVGDVGSLRIVCAPPLSCQATVDGDPASTGVKRWVLPGEHLIALTVDGTLEQHRVRIAPRDNEEVRPTVDVRPLARTHDSQLAPPPVGVSPTWFWIGAGVTATLAGVTIASGRDTASKHDAFLANPTASGQANGSAAQTRTNILFAVTIATGLATGAVGLIGVRWSSKSRATPLRSVGVATSGTGMSVVGCY